MKKRTAKRVLKWIGITLGALLIIIAAGAAVMFGPIVKADGNAQPGSFGCSTIYTQDENGTYFFGRNYDWAECETMIVHTKPENGYESVSTCCLDFLGFGDKYAPDGSMTERMQSIAAIYVPLDGSYEKTMWSIVNCQEGRCADFYFAENYDHEYGLILLGKDGFLKR